MRPFELEILVACHLGGNLLVERVEPELFGCEQCTATGNRETARAEDPDGDDDAHPSATPRCALQQSPSLDDAQLRPMALDARNRLALLLDLTGEEPIRQCGGAHRELPAPRPT